MGYRLVIGLALLLVASIVKGQEICPDPENAISEDRCWRMVFNDNLGMDISAKQIDFMELSVFQGTKELKSARYEKGRLCVSLTKHHRENGALSIKGRCSRRLSTGRIQIWTFELSSIPIESGSHKISILLINYNCI
jgi:hypothetical protein